MKIKTLWERKTGRKNFTFRYISALRPSFLSSDSSVYPMWSQEEVGFTVILAGDWNRNKVWWVLMFLRLFFLCLWSCWSAPTVTGSWLRVKRGLRCILVSRVLVGGEGGEGGGRRERQRTGLRTDASSRGRVCRRLRDTEGRRGDRMEKQEK